MSNTFLRISLITLLFASFLLVFNATAFAADPPKVTWIEGPKTVDLGDVAQVTLNKSNIFANASDTKKLMEYMGDPPDQNIVGMIAPDEDYFDWFVIFDYNPVGYVKDDEKNQIDANALLDSIKKATVEANKTRIKNGASALNVIGWSEKPHYDSVTHNLTWAVLGEDAQDKTKIVNYNTRLLGRSGYMSINLVTDPDVLESCKPLVQQIISSYSWKPGKSYAEWVSGDKVAEIGLTALIAGGAGAVAAKTGLLAKFWYLLVAGAVAIGGFFMRIFKRIFRKKEKVVPYDNQ